MDRVRERGVSPRELIAGGSEPVAGSELRCSRSFMRIGDVQLNPGALLAPMEAVTDLPFRTVCEEAGAILTFTEFLSA
jgi:hypothetical protein